MTGSTGGVHARRSPEPRRLCRLIARDGRSLERILWRLLEDHPEPLERLLSLAAQPSGGADLLQPVDDGGRLAVGRQLHARDAAALGSEVVHGHRPVAPAATDAQLFDNTARTVRLLDLKLRILLRERSTQSKARRGANPHRVDPSQAVVPQVVVRVRGTTRKVAHEVEDLFA